MLIHHRKLLTCLLVAIVGGQYGFLLVTSDYQHLQRDDTEESVYFQAINSYLTDFDSLGVLQQSTVTDRLGNAVEAIESLGKQNFARLDPVRDDAGVKFKTLLDNDPAAVLSIMKSLISASKSCDQESSSFLMLTLNQTFNGQHLNQFARALLDRCLPVNVEILVHKMERCVGKLNSALFDLSAEIAQRLANQKRFEDRRSTNQIVIQEEQHLSRYGDKRNLAEVLKHLKEIHLASESRSPSIGEFAKALRHIFNQRVQEDEVVTKWVSNGDLFTLYHGSLIKPCDELVEKVRQPLSELDAYWKYANDRTNQVLDAKRLVEPEFDEKLEVNRICTEILANKNEIWNKFKTRL